MDDISVDEAIARFKSYIETERRLAKGTVHNYITDLQNLSDRLKQAGVYKLSELASRDIRAWQMWHMDNGETAGTVRKRLSSVSSWLRWLRKRGLYDQDLMAKIKPPRQPKRKPVFFKVSEMEHLYDEGVFGSDFEGCRDALLLRLLYETGIRRSEATGLKETSADLDALTLKVFGKRSKERIIPIEVELAHNIARYIALKRETVGETEWLFVTRKGKQMSDSQVYNIVRKYMRGMSNADRVSPHVFRHSFATHILAEGGDLMAIKELLGHESVGTTEIYAHVTLEHLKDEYKHAHPRGKKKQ